MIKSNVVEQIPTDKHVFICGITGGGKSYLAEKYLTGYEYVVKLDTKDETYERTSQGLSAWEGLKEGKDFTVTHSFAELDEIDTKKIIYVPPYDEQNDDTFSDFFNWIFERGNTIVWIDELYSVGSSFKIPRGLGRVYTQGRSKNVGIWACTQRPSGVPVIAMANSTYWFVFDMPNAADRKKIVDMTGIPKMFELPHGHNFWYYKLGNGDAVKAVLTD